MADEEVIQTLAQFREVDLFRIPPRSGAGGHKSGTWLAADKVFTGRLRIISRNDECELQVIDVKSGDLFASCPVPFGQQQLAVEAAADSSRYFVLRLVDPTSGRHAFLGMGFAERGDAFDFNVALSDHEKYCRRSRDAAAVQAAGPAAAAADSDLKNSDAGILYKDLDLSLKAGETMTIKASAFLDRKVGSNGGGFMAGLPAISSGNRSGSGAVGIPRLSPIAPTPLAQTFTLPAIPGPSSATQELRPSPGEVRVSESKSRGVNAAASGSIAAAVQADFAGLSTSKAEPPEGDDWATFD